MYNKLYKQVRLIMACGALWTLAACGGAETRVDTDLAGTADSMASVDLKPTDEKVPVEDPGRSKQSTTTSALPEREEILRNIDRHLVARQTASDRISIENTLEEFDFQRLLVEVNELDESGKMVRNNLYTVTNLEGGTTKVIRITPPRAGLKLEIHIVKAKSNELTNGEMILVGSRYTPG